MHVLSCLEGYSVRLRLTYLLGDRGFAVLYANLERLAVQMVHQVAWARARALLHLLCTFCKWVQSPCCKQRKKFHQWHVEVEFANLCVYVKRRSEAPWCNAPVLTLQSGGWRNHALLVGSFCRGLEKKLKSKAEVVERPQNCQAWFASSSGTFPTIYLQPP